MSGRNILVSTGVVLFGAIVGYSTMKFVKEENSVPQSRLLASVPMAKLGSQMFAKQLFNVKVDYDLIAQKEDEKTVLKVTATALHNIEAGLTYTWVLPPDVRVLSGQLTDGFGSLPVGESKEFQIEVSGFSKEQKKYVSFEVTGQLKGMPLKREVLITSRIEDTMEYMIHESEKKARLESEKDPKAQKLNSLRNSKFAPENVIK